MAVCHHSRFNGDKSIVLADEQSIVRLYTSVKQSNISQQLLNIENYTQTKLDNSSYMS